MAEEKKFKANCEKIDTELKIAIDESLRIQNVADKRARIRKKFMADIAEAIKNSLKHPVLE